MHDSPSVNAATHTQTQSVVGQRVGPYSVMRVLDQGGMGIVYLAHDSNLQRQVALKAVAPTAEHSATVIERLRREARVLASFSHPNLAVVFGLEETLGTLFLAMEFIEGQSLERLLSRKAMTTADVVRCAKQIASGLEAAHEKGIIHRDLKPGNIMLTPDGTCKILDFGIARHIGQDHKRVDEPALTQSGAIIGTPAYMSPEQLQGDELTFQSDIFSFGGVLYTCLAGVRPFQGQSIQDLTNAILSGEPNWERLSQRANPDIVGIVKRCLAKNLRDRYRHIGDVLLDLQAAEHTMLHGRARNATRHRWMTGVLPWTLTGLAVATGLVLLAKKPSGGSTSSSPAQRYAIPFPENAIQSDLERLQLTLSPNGRSLVVACKTKQGQALWVRSQGDGAWNRIEHGENGHRPQFSTDGEWIAFFRSGHIYKHRPTGKGDPIRLTDATNWYGECWSNDGSLILSPAWGVPIQRIDGADLSTFELTKLNKSGDERAHLCPATVSGTDWTLYNVWKGGEQTDIFATNHLGANKHLVVTNASTPRVARLDRGDYLLFERGSTIFAAPFDVKQAVMTDKETPIADGVMNDGTRFVAYFDVGNDGSLVFVPGTSFAEESRLSFVNPDGSTQPFNDDRLSFCEPVCSAAADKIAVLIKGKIYRCVMYDLKRQTRETVVTGGDTLSIGISADGQTLACTVCKDSVYGIDLISLTDGRLTGRILPTADVYPSDISWTPDSKLIAFSTPAKEGSPSDIWLVEPKSGAVPRAFVSTPGSDTKPVVSPLGGWIAYQSDVAGKAEIYLVSCPDGQTTRQVSNGGGTQPTWSPDGKLLYFISPEGLMNVDVSKDGVVTGKPRVVYNKPFGQSDPIAKEYTIAADGRPLIVEASERRPSVSHLEVIVNWHRLLP